MSDRKIDRRQILKGALFGATSLPLVLPQFAVATALPKLTENDPTAMALGYHIDAKKVDAKQFASYKPNQMCSTCIQLQPGTGEDRGCTFFPGKLVNVNGWCKVWVQKP